MNLSTRMLKAIVRLAYYESTQKLIIKLILYTVFRLTTVVHGGVTAPLPKVEQSIWRWLFPSVGPPICTSPSSWNPLRSLSLHFTPFLEEVHLWSPRWCTHRAHTHPALKGASSLAYSAQLHLRHLWRLPLPSLTGAVANWESFSLMGCLSRLSPPSFRIFSKLSAPSLSYFSVTAP